MSPVADDTQRPTLADLVSKARSDLDMSYRDVEDRSGGVVKHSSVHRIETGERLSVEPRTLGGLSKALKIPIEQLRAANGQTGRVPAEPFTVPDRLNALTAKQRRLLVSIGDALLDRGRT